MCYSRARVAVSVFFMFFSAALVTDPCPYSMRRVSVGRLWGCSLFRFVAAPRPSIDFRRACMSSEGKAVRAQQKFELKRRWQRRDDAMEASTANGANSAQCEGDSKDDQSRKRPLEEASGDATTATAAGSDGAPAAKKPRIPKRRMALMIGFNGDGYQGMQWNPGVRTIESDILEALHKGGVVSDDNAGSLTKIHFQRCARTDKGVSAAGQCISLELLDVDNIVDRVNAHLPPAIRVFDAIRTTNSFNSKNLCNKRRYEYVLPTYAFVKPSEWPEDLSTYRASPETIAAVNRTLGEYVGTHNFHNFTKGRLPTASSSKRYIISFECAEVFVDSAAAHPRPTAATPSEGNAAAVAPVAPVASGNPYEHLPAATPAQSLEFAVLRVVGQSFMLHQIRKMVGVALAVVTGVAPADTIPLSYGLAKRELPKAPGLGLVLDRVYFDSYNERWASDGSRVPVGLERVEGTVHAFKHSVIYPNIVRTECEHMPMSSWVRSLPMHSFREVVPGERRTPLPGDEEDDDGAGDDD